jgi:POT family proton-dependent oligopeptide transporter
MSQNDLLDSEPHNDNRTTEEVENGNFSILIPSIILDRFSYYGFRSLIVLYVVMEFEFDRMQALSQYGLFTMLIYIMAVPGGALGDFVFKSKQSLIIGSIAAAIGAGLCAFPSVELFYTGCIFVIIGIGLYRPNISAHVARITGKDLRLLGQRYLTLYIVINVGAFFGGLLLGLMAETYGYYLGFITVAASWFISAVVLYTAKNNTKKRKRQKIDSRIHLYRKASGFTLLLLIIPVIASVCYWISYEHFYPRYIDSTFELFKSNNSIYAPKYLLMSIGTLITIPVGLILLLIFRKNWLHPLQKMAIGMVLMAMAWEIIYFMPNSMGFNSAVAIYIIFAILMGISELFVTPTLQTLVAAMTPRKILGTITGVSFLLHALGNRYGSQVMYYLDPRSEKFFLPWVCGVLAALLFLLPLFLKKDKIEMVEETDEIELE